MQERRTPSNGNSETGEGQYPTGCDLQITPQQRVTLCMRTTLCASPVYGTPYLNAIASRYTPYHRDEDYVSQLSSIQPLLSSWRPRTTHPVLIIGTKTHNVVICCSTGDAYEMSERVLFPSLPNRMVLVCNCTTDDPYNSLRVLIYDAENIPDSDQGAQCTPFDPNERYALLRKFYTNACAEHVDSHMFTLQWLGYHTAAKTAFESSSTCFPVGHDVGGIVSIQADPLSPIFS